MTVAEGSEAVNWSGRWDSNPRPSAWDGRSVSEYRNPQAVSVPTAESGVADT